MSLFDSNHQHDSDYGRSAKGIVLANCVTAEATTFNTFAGWPSKASSMLGAVVYVEAVLPAG